MESLSKQNDRALNALLQGTSNPKWVTDNYNNLLCANQSFLAFFKLNTEVLYGNITEVFPRQIADSLIETFVSYKLAKKHIKQI